LLFIADSHTLLVRLQTRIFRLLKAGERDVSAPDASIALAHWKLIFSAVG